MGWRTYYNKWKQAMDTEFKIANSLKKNTPYGKNPKTGRKFSSSSSFVKALRGAEKTKNYYKRLTKNAYKRETGKSW